MLGQVAELIGNNINHIDFNRFLTSLNATVQDFNQQINNQPYLLGLAEKIFTQQPPQVSSRRLAGETQ